MRAKRSASRRGVLLLVILGILAMFAMVAVAFVVVTGQAQRAAKHVQRIDQFAEKPERTTHLAAMIALRGDNSYSSVMGPHSLLEDLYGNESTRGAIVGVAPLCERLLFEFRPPPGGGNPYRYGGCVMTMLSGRLTGQSTRIVGINPDNNNVQALSFEGVPPKNNGDLQAALQPSAGDFYVINGAPFSGTGFGFKLISPTGMLDAIGPGGNEHALMPNPIGFPRKQGDPGFDQNYDDPAGPGGANEDYDAVDFQNMLLAAQIMNPDTGQVITIPSLHRPALINYWINRQASPDILRKVILRPMRSEHPDFTGSNPDFDPIKGPWDVDNDGDAQPDGIWVDVGLPVRSTPDGRLYKPLISYLCLDLDGRLNLNAHGSWGQAQETAYKGPLGYKDVQIRTDTPASNAKFANAGDFPRTTASLPRGHGFGTADVNLLPLFFPRPDVTWQQACPHYASLLRGNRRFDGRYGEWATPMVGPGRSGIDDPLSMNVNYDRSISYDPSASYWDFAVRGLASYQPDVWGAPPDVWGAGAVGMDLSGRPLYLAMDWGQGQAVPTAVDDPYEIDLSKKRAHGLIQRQSSLIDNPFGAAELERLFRPFDRDADKLASRLFDLTRDGSSINSVLHRVRHSITSDSWDLPCPSVSLPPHLLTKLGELDKRGPQHVTDLLLAADITNPRVWPQLLPPEVLAGLKLNLNRPLGNGRDDTVGGSANRAVDDPGESALGEELYQVDAGGNPVSGITFDHANDGAASTAYDKNVRALHARHLYVLLSLLVDRAGLSNTLGAGGGTEGGAARYLAQLAVNMVDFYDRDSIMTRFAYDPDFTEGWNPDGTEQHTVWGCERPEMVMTEVVAIHDRRSEDRNDAKVDPPAGGGNEGESDDTYYDTDKNEEGEKRDDDFDQRFRPQGSLFVELFNPWTAAEAPSGELSYDAAGTPAWPRGVRLTQKTSGGASGARSPVWRLIICKAQGEGEGRGEHPDPDDPDPSRRPDVERAAYFVPLADLLAPEEDSDTGGRVRYSPATATDVSIAPGRYAVVGSGGKEQGNYKTYIGFRTDAESGDESTRQIDLGGLDQTDAEIVKNNGDQDFSSKVYRAETLVINSPRRLSISEPADGYEALEKEAEGSPTYDEATGKYQNDIVLDIPLDKKRRDGGDDEDDKDIVDLLMADGTRTGIRMVHLQRLADPTRAWNKLTNPYRTIDSMPVDLTVFNGLTKSRDPDVQDGKTNFETRQRGETEKEQNAGDVVANRVANIWKQEPVEKTTSGDSGGTVSGHVFEYKLRHSLGYLNYEFFGDPRDDPYYKGDPERPMPWLTWNNRPYVSQLELLMVPTERSSKLLVRSKTDKRKHYGVCTKPDAVRPYSSSNSNLVPFPHLANYFHSSRPGPALSGGSPQLHRLLDYVHVPSRFVGTKIQANPRSTVAGNHWFHPPFHQISTYREPGRINLNTVFSPNVWLGLLNYYPGLTDVRPGPNGEPPYVQTFWRKFMESRQGYPLTNGLPYGLNPSLPTRFRQPFRSSSSAGLVPIDALMPTREVDVTVLRSELDSARPLFSYDELWRSAMAEGRDPEQYGLFNNPDANPYSRYHPLQRLGNLVTTRSNVYALWVTVGYFEVAQRLGGPDQAHPDGYQLGRELGIDTGDTKRHRAFYIFDRSIPVGFQRGQDLNVENAILIKRFIE